MGEAQTLFERYARLQSRAERMTDTSRLDLADDAERLMNDARRFLDIRPTSDAVSVIRSIGQNSAMIANEARAR